MMLLMNTTYAIVREVVQTYGFESQVLNVLGGWQRFGVTANVALLTKDHADAVAAKLGARVVSYSA